jgi:uncharacterized damage-inducible protein DinB
MNTHPEPTLVELLRYNNWANAQVLAGCRELTDDQLASAAPGSFGSIRDTLEHIIRAEADYVGRMTGGRPRPQFDWRKPASMTDLSAFADHVGRAVLDVV